MRRIQAGVWLGCLILCAVWVQADEHDTVWFTDHGVVAAAPSIRGLAAVEDQDGRPLVVALARFTDRGEPHSSLLLIDAMTGETRTFLPPTPVSGAPFSFLHASNNRFYTSFGNLFVEFDIDREAFTFSQRTPGSWISFWAEAPDGRIYAATRNKDTVTCNLLVFDPAIGRLDDLGVFHTQQENIGSMLIDDDGWLYAGIGTAQSDLVAYHIESRQKHSLALESQRRRGTGHVRRGTDGLIYGRPHWDKDVGWYRLSEGKAQPMPEGPVIAPRRAETWQRAVSLFPSGGRIVAFDLADRLLTFTDGQKRRYETAFTFEITGGASATSMTLASDGRMYGSTSHPMRMWRYDPTTDELTDLGGIARIGNGNFTRLLAVGDAVYGIAYMGGHVFRYDPSAAFDPGDSPANNPRYLYSYNPQIARPRAMAYHPNGYLLFGGLPTDGMAGGGLGIYSLDSDEFQTIDNQAIHPGHSTVGLGVLSSGHVVGATSVTTTGGARQRADVAMIYLLDLGGRQILDQVEPFPDASIISCIEVGPREQVYGVTWDGRYFVYDPEKRQVIHRGQFGAYGKRPLAAARPSMIVGPDHAVYAVTDLAVVKIDPDDYTLKRIAPTPVAGNAGLVYHNGIMYFTAGERLFSFKLDEALMHQGLLDRR